jgi:hypothetical protein
MWIKLLFFYTKFQIGVRTTPDLPGNIQKQGYGAILKTHGCLEYLFLLQGAL